MEIFQKNKAITGFQRFGVSNFRGGKVNLIVSAAPDAVKAGAHAGNIIKKLAPLVGGGGGGRDTMAQAGGKNPAGIGEMIASAKDVVEEML